MCHKNKKNGIIILQTVKESRFKVDQWSAILVKLKTIGVHDFAYARYESIQKKMGGGGGGGVGDGKSVP